MSNCIRRLFVSDHIKDPTHADVSVRVYTERVTNKTEIRGRLTGPRCAYSSTVEIAYPIHMVHHEYGKEDDPHISTRVTIPEPCIWEPETPFLYQGIVELWQSGKQIEQVSITRALREVKLGLRGFRLNRRPFTLRGVARKEFLRADLPELRQTGFNTLMTPVNENCADLCDAADRLGFFIIWQVSQRECFKRFRPLNNQDHPSFLGGVVMPQAEEPENIYILADASFPTREDSFVGIWLTQPSPVPLPKESHFVLCHKSLLPSLADIKLPKLVLTSHLPMKEPEQQELSATPGIMGWIEDQST